MSRPEERGVPVAGGDLAVTCWPGDPAAEPVIALHGITANSRTFTALARELSDRPVYAPDLRGRAGSRALPGPYGLTAHVSDVLALHDHLAPGRQVTLLGHSMGAFVAALAASRHPGRYSRVVLADGGLGFPAPPGTDLDAQLEAVIGPAMRRLSLTFPDRAAYRAFFRDHPALAAHWGPDIETYVDHDLTGSPPALRSSCLLEAVRADGADVLTGPVTPGALRRLTVPATLLWAERGLLNEPQGLYDAARVAAAGLAGTAVTARAVPDTNHYTILLAPHGVRALAEEVRA
ncbi:alpha/beta hydrolase [Streptomyces sp. ACA25]|uniref:alpha/beta hydrolase n=1 Tax=Streptomyces sp. ACA25 TaxID=3022596 RepID=UPI002307AA2C|nr:alpha/beta hydrolase [Streptomyces sp. ACA25]MDB1088003.1 alpha/beta hydrolase [Streptomyces sp. ACA25]